MNQPELQQAILNLVSDPNYQPVKPKVLLKKLQLEPEFARDVRRAVKSLAKQGQVAYGANHVVGRPGAKDVNRLTGVYRRTSGGYGFVTPAVSAGAAKAEQDIFIPAGKGLDAAHGDIVLVRLTGKRGRPRGNPEGEVAQVIERETNQFVGTYFESGGQGLVQVDGRMFNMPILVGDPGAKGARPDDKVVLEMVRFPSHVHDGEGVIAKVLGQRGDPGVDTLSIIHEFNLPGEFADDALEDARDQASKFDESIDDDRRDLTGETIITIDPVDARDFDDAISLQRIENDHWLLGVHIADVSHFVPTNSALDREAHDRATSVYLPDRVIPMLPEVISNNLASLQPDKVRYTKTVFIEFTPSGARVATDPCAAAIRSARRFTYEEVDAYLADRAGWKKKLSGEVHGLLGRMHELAMILRKRRVDRGSLNLTMPEVKIDLDKDGRVSGAHLVENTESHQIIEEFMLAANEAVAQLLEDKEILFLRRIHEDPDPRKLKALTEFMHELKVPCESLESRFEIQRVLAEVAGKPEEQAVNYAVLRSMQKAVYSPLDEGHYALASDSYCHFTSPIRRYPDLTVHRLLDDLFHRRTPTAKLDELLALGEHCSQREQRATAAERELTKVKLLHYFAERIGEEMEAVVTGVEEFGLFCRGLEIPAEGLIHVSSLSDDYYRFDRAAHSLVGRRAGNSFRLGDLVRVAIARVDIERRELDLRIVGRVRRTKVDAHAYAGKSKNGHGPRKSKQGKPSKPKAGKKRRR